MILHYCTAWQPEWCFLYLWQNPMFWSCFGVSIFIYTRDYLRWKPYMTRGEICYLNIQNKTKDDEARRDRADWWPRGSQFWDDCGINDLGNCNEESLRKQYVRRSTMPDPWSFIRLGPWKSWEVGGYPWRSQAFLMYSLRLFRNEKGLNLWFQ